MKLASAAALTLLLASSGAANAHHKTWHQIPPGHLKKIYSADAVIPASVEFVCLVATQVVGDPYSPVISSSWLPRSEAEARANEGDGFVIFHPSVNTERGCIDF